MAAARRRELWVLWTALAVVLELVCDGGAEESGERVVPGWDGLPAGEPEQAGPAGRAASGKCAGASCRCVPQAQCSATSGGTAAGIDIRIVNTGWSCPSACPSACPPGSVPCCVSPCPSACSPSCAPACGQRSVQAPPAGYRLSAGQARPGEFPWQAMLLQGADGRFLGAGALVAERFVLTAAHVLPADGSAGALVVRLGEWDTALSAAGRAPWPPLEVGVARAWALPGFDARSLAGDAALLQLAAPAPPPSTAPHIRSACLPPPSPAQNGYDGQRCWVAGWGVDAFAGGRWQRRLRAVDVGLVTAGECQARLQATRLGPAFALDAAAFLCAGGQPGKDACTGDGGGALVCQPAGGGGWQVVGLVSWGIGCGDAGVPGVYTNVATFVPWLQQIMATGDAQQPQSQPQPPPQPPAIDPRGHYFTRLGRS